MGTVGTSVCWFAINAGAVGEEARLGGAGAFSRRVSRKPARAARFWIEVHSAGLAGNNLRNQDGKADRYGSPTCRSGRLKPRVISPANLSGAMQVT